MQPITVTVGPLTAASANNIALSQTVSGAANVVLNGSLVTSGVAILDVPRQVLITNAGNDTGITFTVTGTNWSGQTISQTLTGTSGSTVATTLDFKTVTRIATSGSTSASGITVGTNGVAGSKWVRFDDFAPAGWSVQVDVSGTVNYSVQTTMDDPNNPVSPTTPANVQWVSASDSGVVSQSTTKYGYSSGSSCYVRVLLNSGTGSVSATFLQSSNVPL